VTQNFLAQPTHLKEHRINRYQTKIPRTLCLR
jgi:hypothetical protein